MPEACTQSGIPIAEGALAMAVYHGISETTGLLSAEVQFSLPREYKSADSFTVFQIPKRDMISIIFKGSYSQIFLINTVVAEWLEKNSLEINGQSFTIYHNSPGNCPDASSFITELCFPVQKKS